MEDFTKRNNIDDGQHESEKRNVDTLHQVGSTDEVASRTHQFHGMYHETV